MKTKTSTHTPGPLLLRTYPDDYPDVVSDREVEPGIRENRIIAQSVGTEADGRRLVLCWNVHDDLVAALETLADATYPEEGSGTRCPDLRVVKEARAAIAKATRTPNPDSS